jgi:tetratricopeptide (TPR) repeat protein
VFVLQDEVARQIAAALEVNLTRAAGAPRARAATIQGDAFELFARGRSHLLTQSLEDANRAVECFQKALELDPSFARAYAGLADAYARIAFTWIPEGEWYDRAEAMCTRALALDPQLAEGRYLRGRLLWSPRGGFDHAGAIREFTAAIAAQPSLNEAHHWLGILLFHVSLLDESAACMERALAIDPNDRTALLNLGYRAYLAGRLEEALRVSRESGRDVTSAWNLYTVALVHVQSGSLDAAEQSAEVAARRFPADVLFHPLRALIAALRGDRAAALRHIETTVRNERAFGHYHHAQYDVACAYAQLGVADQAIAWLTAAAKHGFPCAAFFERDRLLDPLRSEPEFQHVVAAARKECEEYARLYRSLRAS